jgi:DNA-binding IclR family transcriptional regulator
MTTRVQQILQHLSGRSGWVSPKKIAELIGIPRGDATARLCAMAKRGLVQMRQTHEGRYRTSEWKITLDGRRYIVSDPRTRRELTQRHRPGGYGDDGGCLLQQVWRGP